MRINKIIWGVLLLFVGGVLLLQNLNIIDFYWKNAWSFWPVLLIVFGTTMLFNRNGSQLGSKIALGILGIALIVLFIKGQHPKNNINAVFYEEHLSDGVDDEDMQFDDDEEKTSTLFETFNSDSVKKVELNIKGAGAEYEIKDATDSLFFAKIKGKSTNYVLRKFVSDSVATLTFELNQGRGKKHWNFGEGNGVEMFLNKQPEYKMNLSLGAGKLDFDLKDFKVREINFNGGAAELDLTVGDLLAITDVNVHTGVADINVKIPTTSGCIIKTKTGLSSRDFDGFTKISDGVYQTPNYKTAAKKIFINFDGGLSSFEVERY